MKNRCIMCRSVVDDALEYGSAVICCNCAKAVALQYLKLRVPKSPPNQIRKIIEKKEKEYDR